MTLEELLGYMRIVDLVKVIDRFSLECSRSGRKEKIIGAILKSEQMTIEHTRKSVRKIAELFAMGGKDTLSLYKLNTKTLGEDVDVFELISDAFSGFVNKEIRFETNKFKVSKYAEFDYQKTTVTDVEFLYPSSLREVFDYYEGPTKYTPTVVCKCLIWGYGDYLLLDIRASRTVADTLAKCISSRILGMDGVHLKVTPSKVRLSKDLAEKLHKKLKARNFILKVLQDDEVDSEGVLHPRSVEYTTAKHDFKTERSKLKVMENAEDTGHGLEFSVEHDGFILMENCKILLNFQSNQVTFIKLTPIGVYEIVIDEILGES